MPRSCALVVSASLLLSGAVCTAAQAADRLSDTLRAWTPLDLQLPPGTPANFEVRAVINGQEVTLDLGAFSMRGPAFQVLVDQGGPELVPTPVGAPCTYRGSIRELPGTSVSASLVNRQVRALIFLPDGTTYAIQPVADFIPERRAVPHVIYRAADAIAPEGICGNVLGDPEGPKERPEADGGLAGANPGWTEFAAETDYEFFQLNGSSVTNTVNDIEAVMNNVDLIYDRDASIAYEFTTFVIRSVAADPYTSATIDGRLNEFEAKWNILPESEIQRDVAQMFSGVNFSGGVIGLAPLGVVCNTSYAYSVVESRYTNTLSYRTSLSAHELGHNWSCLHCDSAGSANCHIMCSSNGGCGGISGTNLKLDTVSVGELDTYRAQVTCETNLPAPLTIPFGEYFTGTLISPTNWLANNGAAIAALAPNEPSAPYALNLDCTTVNPYGDDEIRSNYLPLNGVTGVTFAFRSLHLGVDAGEQLFAEYLNTAGDWIALVTVTSDGVDQNLFSTHSVTLPSGALNASFRFRFRAAVGEVSDDWYIDDVTVTQGPAAVGDDCGAAVVIGEGTFSFNSTNATSGTLTIPASCNDAGNTTFVKDVWFRFVPTCSGTATVSTCGQAAFDTRIAVYANTCPTTAAPLACSDNAVGCANYTSRAEFTAVAGSPYLIRVGGVSAGGVGSLTVSCGASCIADLNSDGYVNGADLGLLLANWAGTGVGDVTGDGFIDGADLSVMLGGFGTCP